MELLYTTSVCFVNIPMNMPLELGSQITTTCYQPGNETIRSELAMSDVAQKEGDGARKSGSAVAAANQAGIPKAVFVVSSFRS